MMNLDQNLHKYLNRQSSKDEKAALQEDEAYADYLKIATRASALDLKGFKDTDNWHKIKAHITKNSVQKKGRMIRLKNMRVNQSKLWRVAAILVMVFGTYFFLTFSDTTITTMAGKHENWAMPDGSKITFNAVSQATYNRHDWDEDRRLTFKGEAYFDVVKGGSLTVETHLGNVRVLGTEFNVLARGDHFRVACYEGSVEVTVQNTTTIIKAGQGLVLKSSGLEMMALEDTAPGWLRGESSFDQEPLADVLEELSRQYGLSIDQNQIPEEQFTGSFSHDNLRHALTAVCAPFNLKFTITEKQVTIHAAE